MVSLPSFSNAQRLLLEVRAHAKGPPGVAITTLPLPPSLRFGEWGSSPRPQVVQRTRSPELRRHIGLREVGIAESHRQALVPQDLPHELQVSRLPEYAGRHVVPEGAGFDRDDDARPKERTARPLLRWPPLLWLPLLVREPPALLPGVPPLAGGAVFLRRSRQRSNEHLFTAPAHDRARAQNL